MKPSHELDEGIIPGSRHLYVSHEMIGLPELQHIVASGVALWQRRMQQGDQVGREQAARAIKELSQILDSLSQQLAQGRRTMRITTRLPRTRTYTVGCPACGHGNRQEARFCQSCGTMLSSQAARIQPAGDPKLYLQTASQTDTGRQRPINEDTCAITTLQVTPQGRIMLLLVADGMGGAQAGEQASHLASEMVQQYLVQRVTQTPSPKEGAGLGVRVYRIPPGPRG
ncbi:MAG: hypothetical protein HC837_20205 [Chloroflexaceae bacterium]|nr:hypothetical protein [Chloroflexaceae bacterium]